MTVQVTASKTTYEKAALIALLKANSTKPVAFDVAFTSKVWELEDPEVPGVYKEAATDVTAATWQALADDYFDLLTGVRETSLGYLIRKFANAKVTDITAKIDPIKPVVPPVVPPVVEGDGLGE